MTAPASVLHFFVCVNERSPGAALPSCGSSGRAIYEAFAREIARRGNPPGLKVTATGCLTPCQVGPSVVLYPAGTWYSSVAPADVAELISAALNGETVVRLLKSAEVRVW